MKPCATYQYNHYKQAVVSVLVDGGSWWNSEGMVLKVAVSITAI